MKKFRAFVIFRTKEYFKNLLNIYLKYTYDIKFKPITSEPYISAIDRISYTTRIKTRVEHNRSMLHSCFIRTVKDRLRGSGGDGDRYRGLVGGVLGEGVG